MCKKKIKLLGGNRLRHDGCSSIVLLTVNVEPGPQVRNTAKSIKISFSPSKLVVYYSDWKRYVAWLQHESHLFK